MTNLTQSLLLRMTDQQREKLEKAAISQSFIKGKSVGMSEIIRAWIDAGCPMPHTNKI